MSFRDDDLLEVPRGTKVYNRERTAFGTTTGGVRSCQLEDCSGTQIAVRWPDGELAYPCSEGMRYHDGTWGIGFEPLPGEVKAA